MNKKIHLFYLHDDEITQNKYPAASISMKHYDAVRKQEVLLYAFTPSKKIAKEFRNTRNMNIFREEIVEMDEDDYEDIIDCNNDLSKLLLEYHLYNTQSLDKESNQYFKDQRFILSTSAEFDKTVFRFIWRLKDKFYEETNGMVDAEYIDLFTEPVQDFFVRELDFYEVMNLMDLTAEVVPYVTIDFDMVVGFCEMYHNLFNVEV